MTFLEWAESIGAKVAATDATEDIDMDDLIERAGDLLSDEDVQALGRAMLKAYHGYICAFIDSRVAV